MRKWLSILFVLSITAPFVGLFGWLSVEKQMLRKEVKHQLMSVTSNEELKTLQFEYDDTLKLLKWEHEKEFEYDGEMYDVVRRSYSTGKVTYHVWWDHEETVLNQKLDRLTTSLFNKSPEKKRTSQQLSFFLLQLFISQNETVIHPLLNVKRKEVFAYQDLKSKRFIDVSTPPPIA